MKIPSDDIENRLLPRYLTGDITDSERIIVDEWVAASGDNKRVFIEYKKIWEKAEISISHELNLPVIDIDAEWDHQMGMLQKSRRGLSITADRDTSTTPWFRIAASISFILLASFSLYYFTGGFGETYLAKAKTEEFSFKDGTTVTLLEGSEISYKRSYNKSERHVVFTGEAYFEVTPDSERPFIIETQGAKIQVVGTTFNVRAMPGESLVEVTVTSGQVMLMNDIGDHAVALKVNDKGTFNPQTGEINRIDNDNINFLAWKTGMLKFDNTSLKDVVSALNRAYPEKEILLKLNRKNNCSLTVSFDSQSIESIMLVMESTLDLTYQIKGDKIEITEAGC